MDDQNPVATPGSGTPQKRWRLYVLLVSGLVIAVVVFLRQRQLDEWRESPPQKIAPRRLAPRFELADHRRHLVKFERFLGRQRVVVVFFDSQLGVQRDPRLQPLIKNFERIDSAGIKIVAISDATPFANQQAEKQIGKIPFPLLTDIDVRVPVLDPVHRLWGRYDEKADQPLTGLFLVARDGTVAVSPEGKPVPVEDEQAALETLSRGEWP